MSKNIKVSDEFVNIYKHFNIYNQFEQIKKLSDIEKYLLLVLCLDKHDDNNNVVISNFLPFKDECMEILEAITKSQSQESSITDNIYLLKLIELTGDPTITTDKLIQSNGEGLFEPISLTEIREIKINDLIK